MSNMKNPSPLVSIGMPVYNGEKFISEAIESLLAQSFKDWGLLISDNNSSDHTEEICRKFSGQDERIKYIKHPQNNGVMANYHCVLNAAETPYFMWAATDDVWDPIFIESCLNGISGREDIGAAFSDMENIDSHGRVIRTYPSFGLFACESRAACIASFMLEPKYNGKANLMYSLFKLKDLKGYMLNAFNGHAAYPQSFDVAFVLGILCRTGLFIDERKLFKKRFARETDLPNHPDLLTVEQPYANELLQGHDVGLYQDLILANTRGTGFEELVDYLLYYRKTAVAEMKTGLSLRDTKSAPGLSRFLSRVKYYLNDVFRK